MLNIHCHSCGGFIGNPGGTTYRVPSAATPPVAPHSAFCTCDHSVVYGTAPGPEEGLRGMHHIRSTSRN